MADKYSLSAVWDSIASWEMDVSWSMAAERDVGSLMKLFPIENIELSLLPILVLVIIQIVSFAALYVFILYLTMWVPAIGKFKLARIVGGEGAAMFSRDLFSMCFAAIFIMPIYTMFIMTIVWASPVMQMLKWVIGDQMFFSLVGFMNMLGYAAWGLMGYHGW